MGGGGESNTLCEDIAAAFQCGFVPQMCANWYAKLQFSSCIIKHVIRAEAIQLMWGSAYDTRPGKATTNPQTEG